MRIILVTLCTVVLFAAAPSAAQSLPGPILQVTGPATPGALVAIDIGQAAPGGLAVLAYGFAQTPTPIGIYATLDIALAGVLVLGIVPDHGMIFSALRVPPDVPPELHGLVIYFQAVIIRTPTRITDPEIALDVTGPQSAVLEVPPPPVPFTISDV